MSSEQVDAAARRHGPRAQRIQAVDRAAELLKSVAAAESPPTAAELAQRCGINRTTAWRMLATLEDHGLVERDPSQRYGIGYGAVALAQSRSGSAALVRIAHPTLEQLANETGETVNLSVARHHAVVAIDQIDPPDAALLLNYLTKRMPLHCTSNGKVVLASLSDAQLDAALAAPLEQQTSQTITDPQRLRAIVTEVRRDGYAITIGELDIGINGVSAGVVDDQSALVAIISVSAPAHRLPEERLHLAVPAIQRAAAAIQRRLGDLRCPARHPPRIR